jgi:RND family efflux transporter MFP subunit
MSGIKAGCEILPASKRGLSTYSKEDFMFHLKKLKTIIMSKKIMMISVSLIVILLATFLLAGGKPTSAGNGEIFDAVTVETETVRLMDSIGVLTYKANLEPAEEAAVSSNTAGQVTQVLFENGDRVTQGQPLAYLDDKDLQNRLKTAKLDLSKLLIDLDAAKSDYDIAAQLYAEGACSKTSYEDAMRNYQTVQADIQLKEINIQDINNSLSDCVLKAPISGEAGGKNISVGQYVNPGTVVAVVKNNASIKAVIQLMQDDLDKVAVGQEVILKLGKDDEITYKGVVRTIAASADSRTRVFDCLVEINNDGGTLNSGTFAYLEIPNKDKIQILTVPMSAVVGSEGDYSVLLLKDGTAQRVSVEIGEITGERVEILSGLREGDRIITTNLNTLQDGDKVTVAGEGE